MIIPHLKKKYMGCSVFENLHIFSSIKLLPGDGNVWDFFFFLLHLLSFSLHTPEVISVG